MSDALVAALNELVDARLVEHGLLEVEKPKGAKGKPAGKAKAAADDDEVTFETLKEKISELVNSKGKDAAKAILKTFKVEKLSDVAEAKFAKINAALDEALGEEGGEDLFGD